MKSAIKQINKFNSWVKYSAIAFIACILNFAIWINSGNGEHNPSLWLGIITLIIWGYATSKGFRAGVFKND